jgi:flagellin-like protein
MLSLLLFRLSVAWNDFIEEERGETNLIAILLIIVVVIALVAVFRTRMSTLINDFFDNITNEAGLSK